MPKLTKENIATIQDALFYYARESLDLIKRTDSEIAKRGYNKIVDAFNAIGEFDGGNHTKWADKFKEKGE